LAALAPGYSYKIIDENIDGVDLELEEIKEADLIGLTVMTAQTPRAYELADRFRRMGCPPFFHAKQEDKSRPHLGDNIGLL